MSRRVAVISGDGVGPEVVAEARKAVDALGLGVEWNELPWGTGHYHATGAMMPYVYMMCVGLLVVILVPWFTLILPRVLGLG